MGFCLAQYKHIIPQELIFQIAMCLTIVNIAFLCFFDDQEMKIQYNQLNKNEIIELYRDGQLNLSEPMERKMVSSKEANDNYSKV